MYKSKDGRNESCKLLHILLLFNSIATLFNNADVKSLYKMNNSIMSSL